MTDLSADLVMHPFVRVTPFKGARAEDAGRLVPLSPATARAIVAYRRFRRDHKHALPRRGDSGLSGLACRSP
jgi:hypothetical protein